MGKAIRCHECASRMARDVRKSELAYKGHVVVVEQPGWYCTKAGCGEVVFEGEDSAVTEQAFMRLKSEVDGIMIPQEVARIRRKLGLSQRRAGALLGGGPRSFQKYESGTDWVTRSMANLLRLLDCDPARLEEIVAAGERSGRTTTRSVIGPAAPRASRKGARATPSARFGRKG